MVIVRVTMVIVHVTMVIVRVTTAIVGGSMTVLAPIRGCWSDNGCKW